MDDETKKLLLENAEVSRKTFEIVQKMERRFFWQRVLKMAKWIIIIALLGLSYWQAQPYIGSLLAIYQNIGGTLDQVQGAQRNIPIDLQKLLGQ